jgi:nicotinamide riboside transporter PnuC
VFSDLHTWGWIVAIAGTLTILAGFSVFSGSELARWFGIFMAGLQALAQLMMIQAYPFWSLCVFAMDILVIYGLAVYGGKRLRGNF